MGLPQRNCPQSNKEMKELVLKYGFVYSRRGCSCSGSPYIYRRETYEITIYEHRGVFVLTNRNTAIAKGKANELEQELKNLTKYGIY